MPKLKIDDTVKIRFFDHTEGESGLLEFFVYGKLVKKTKSCLTVQSWCYADSDEFDSNVVQFNISRPSIVDVVVLKET